MPGIHETNVENNLIADWTPAFAGVTDILNQALRIKIPF